MLKDIVGIADIADSARARPKRFVAAVNCTAAVETGAEAEADSAPGAARHCAVPNQAPEAFVEAVVGFVVGLVVEEAE